MGRKHRSFTLRAPVFLAVGLLIFAWLLNTPGGLLGKADAVGYAVCHRIEVRSFHLGDRAVPLCARCTGMYLGAVLGLAYQGILRPRRSGAPPWKVAIPLGLMAAAFILDGLNSYLHFFPNLPTLYEPSNAGRLFTGTGMGLVIAAALYPAFNSTVWKNWNSQPALDSVPALGGLLVLALILDGLVWLENPLILYPLALISAGGVLALLSMIYAILWLMLVRVENRFLRKRELLLPLTAGLGVAVLQIAAIGFVRFWLTGTWGGFVFG